MSLLMLCIGLSAGCRQKSTESFNTECAVRIQVPDRAYEPADLRDVFEGPVRMVPLETTAPSLIANVEKVLYDAVEQLYFLMDTRMGRCVQIFSADGRHVGAVKRIGRGPGEFDRPTDMSLDLSRRELHIYAQNSSKIIRNDYAGRYLDEQHVKYYPNDFAIHDGHYLLSMFNQLVSLRHPRYNLYVTDYGFSTPKGHFVQERDKEKYGDGPAFNLWPAWDGSVLYVPPHAARIYRIGRGDAVSLAYDVDFGTHALPESFFREGYSEEQFFLERRNRTFAYDLTSLFENERYLIGSFTSGTTLCTFIYSKATGRTKVMAGLYARLDTPVGYKPFGLNEADEVLWLVDARAFSAAARRPDDIPDGTFKDFAARISDADNPVMVWYKIKPF